MVNPFPCFQSITFVNKSVNYQQSWGFLPETKGEPNLQRRPVMKLFPFYSFQKFLSWSKSFLSCLGPHLQKKWRPKVTQETLETFTDLDKAVVEGEVVADGVPPARAAGPEVVVVIQNPLVDVAEHEFLVAGTQDRHGNEADVRVVRFGLLV